MPHSGPDNSHEQTLERFRALGLEARHMRGGHCVIASMDLGPEPFETLAAPISTSRVLFSAVGRDRIKCLGPRFLFALPILNLRGCSSPAAIEELIRKAWREHIQELRTANDWLSDIGVENIRTEAASVLSFAVEGETPAARVRVRDTKQLILPACGPLSGVTLQDPEMRTLPVNRSCDSAVDLEIGVSNRLEELARVDSSRADRQRRNLSQGSSAEPGRVSGRRPHSVLLVGRRLVGETACIESLRLRGYRVHRAVTAQEALTCFGDLSPELVVADVLLGRSEGIDLILAMRELPGVEDIPVLLVDEHHRPARRDAARGVGAAGYLTYPIDVSRIAARLSGILDGPKRRFTRYDQRLSVRINGMMTACTTSSLGRGGMFISTPEQLPQWGIYGCQLALPGYSEAVGLEAEVRYCDNSRGLQHGVGMRFHGFSNADEARLIDYLRTLDSGTEAVHPS